ncbi:MAG: 3-oxoacyl-ACP reductase FabG [Oscillospiraceae bacterium]|nr:3-oxoacyl-ACP reductase FabG [Oscillospiraceae bacterium]
MNTVLVTGASRGIGKEIATEFASLGYAVAINYNKSKDAANTLAMHLMKEYKVPCGAYKADVKNPLEIKTMVESVKSELGSIIILVNNAGISTQKMFTDLTGEDWKEMLATHLDGCFNCTKEVLPHMISRKHGKIINISSMWGVAGGSCEVHYSTAKAGIIGFTKSLAKEVAPSGINVNCVCPGVIKTDMLNIFDENTLNNLQQQTSLKRLGTPTDVAKAVAFLASKEADYITGAVLNVNGGFF